jgi:PAS domain S-box-containing protein
MSTAVQALTRRPARFDFGPRYPRLLATGVPARDAETWRAQTELILNAAGEGIYGLDVDGRCTFVNPAAARMTGHEVEELLGQSMHDLVHHSHTDGRRYSRETCPIYAAFNDGMVRNVCEEVFWRKDGGSFAVEYTSTPIFNGDSLVGAVVVFRDITLRRRTEDRLRSALLEVQRLKERLERESQSSPREVKGAHELKEIVGSSPALMAALRLVHRVAPTEATVLVQGETGTGKELFARAVHRLSRRANGPLVRVNCGAISPALADSELFGHERGAFTGAVNQRIGRFEQARGGTLFLDEIGELPLDTQSKLLRVLQEREFERVGGTETLSTDVRVVAATHRDLRACVRNGSFRGDLFFRLNVLPLSVPALRDRLEDLPALVDAFLRRLEIRGARSLGSVTPSGIARLSRYHWPGNVRELENVIECAAVLSEGVAIEIADDLLSFFGEASPAEQPAPQHSPRTNHARPISVSSSGDSVPFAKRQSASSGALEPASGCAVPSAPRSLKEVERSHILDALERTHWRLSGPSGAAVMLGVHPNTLRHRMKKLDIRR